MSLGSFSKYAKVTVTPSTETLLHVSNPLGETPKYVHVDCPITSAAYKSGNGAVRFCSLWNEMFGGTMLATNGSTGTIYTAIMKKSDTDISAAANQYYYLGADYISVQGAATVSGRWKDTTEYTVHIYA